MSAPIAPIGGGLAGALRAAARGYRGRIEAGAALAALTWFRVGGPAEALAHPVDEEDLALLLAATPPDVPITVVGLGSNLIVRDGGLPGLALRLAGPGFARVTVEGEAITAGAGLADVKLARAAADAGVDGFAFLRGVPGGVGGALRMNAGAHGGEIADLVVEAHGLTRAGQPVRYDREGMGFAYRRSAVPAGVVFTAATFRGTAGDPAAIRAAMDAVARAREATQPVRERTGGSTFKNPPGLSAWKLVDAAGCRGLRRGGAMVSTMHANFLVNAGGASAADVEGLGEEVRARVLATSGVALEWEIKRIGVPAP